MLVAPEVLDDAAIPIEQVEREVRRQPASSLELIALGRREHAQARRSRTNAGRAGSPERSSGADHHALDDLVGRATTVVHDQDLRHVTVEVTALGDVEDDAEVSAEKEV
jgi:hypothetical protein